MCQMKRLSQTEVSLIKQMILAAIDGDRDAQDRLALTALRWEGAKLPKSKASDPFYEH